MFGYVRYLEKEIISPDKSVRKYYYYFILLFFNLTYQIFLMQQKLMLFSIQLTVLFLD